MIESPRILILILRERVGKIATDLVRAKGRVAMAVFHDLNQAIEMSDRLVFMKEGKIEALAKSGRR